MVSKYANIKEYRKYIINTENTAKDHRQLDERNINENNVNMEELKKFESKGNMKMKNHFLFILKKRSLTQSMYDMEL